MSSTGKSWISWVYPFKFNRSQSRCSSASEASEYFSANDWTPDPDKKSVSWDETNFEKVRVFDGSGDKVNLVKVVPNRSKRKIDLQRNIRYTRKTDQQPLKTIERRKMSKEKSVPIIRRKQAPQQDFIDELRRVEKLIEREAYSLSKYRVIKQRESRFDVSNLPSENEIKGGTLDSAPRLNPLLTKYDNLRSVSLELHHRKTLQYENLKQESPVKEIADGICLELLGVTSDSRDSMEGVGTGEVSNKQDDHDGKDSEIYQSVNKQEIVGQEDLTEILHDDLIQGIQENRHDLHQDLQDLRKLQEKFIDLHEDLQSEEVRDDLRELHEVLLKDVRDDLLDLHEDILDLQDLQNAGIKIVLVEPVQTSDPSNQDSTPEDVSSPESNQQDSTPDDSTPESIDEPSQPKVTVPILVSFKDKYSDMFEEGPERKVSFRDTTGAGELHQVLYYSGSEDSFIPETSPILTLSGGFDDLSDIEIDFPESEEIQTQSEVTMTTFSEGNHVNNTTISGVNSTDTMLQIEKDFVNVRGGTSAEIMMELEKHFLDIGDRMNFMLESGPKHNALPRRIRQDSLTEVREYGISGSVELLDSVQEESLPVQEDQEKSGERSVSAEETLSLSSRTPPIMENKACLDEPTCMDVVVGSNLRSLSTGSDEFETDMLKGGLNRATVSEGYQRNQTTVSEGYQRNQTTVSEGYHRNEANFSGISDMEGRKDEGALLPRNYPAVDEKKKVLTILLGQRITTRVGEEEEEEGEETGSFKTAEESGNSSEKPARPQNGILCPVFNDKYVMNMVARTAFVRKMSETPEYNKKIGAPCPLENMEIQFNKLGGKGADIAVLTSKGILNSSLTEEFNPFQLNTFRLPMIRITSLRRPKNRLPPLKKGPSSRVLPKIPSPLKKKKKNAVEPCSVTSRSPTLDTFSPTEYLRHNGFVEYQREQRPGQDSDFSDSDSEYHGNHGNTANHFLKGKVNFTVLGEEYLPGFAKERFRQIFDMYDKNGDNVINVEELRGILEILGYSPTPDEVKTILERFDQDNSGTIDFDEYLVLIQHWIEQDEEQIYEAFKVFDRDGDGFVSAQELKRALTQYGEQFTEDEANEFFNMMDTDGDGVINYEEFVEYLRSMQKYSTE